MSDIDQEIMSTSSPDNHGSMERALAGNFEFSISAILKESWERVKGNKGTIWLALILYLIVAGVVAIVFKSAFEAMGFVLPEKPEFTLSYFALSSVSSILQYIIIGPIAMGLIMVAIKIAADQPRQPTDIFNYFPYVGKLLATYIVMFILILIGFCLFILPGIYLAVAYYLALPLVVEKNLNVWQALEASRKAVTHVWFRVFFLFLILMLIIIISIIPLGIGLVWTLPLMMIAYGVVYRNIFGVEQAVVVNA